MLIHIKYKVSRFKTVQWHDAHICYFSKQTGLYASLIDSIIRLLWPSPIIDQLT